MNIEDLKDKHKGQRLFIIGNGPSINNTNLKLIKDEISLAFNCFFLGYEKYGIKCPYYGIGDGRIWTRYKQEISDLDTSLLIGTDVAEAIVKPQYRNILSRIKRPYVIKYNQKHKMWSGEGYFSKDLTKGTYTGNNSVTDIGLQAAYYMGFDKVYLLGCDCSYNDGFHFYDKKYEINAGTSGFNDNSIVNQVMKSYRVCKRIFEEDDREIINCTVGGNLEVFKRMTLEEVMNEVNVT